MNKVIPTVVAIAAVVSGCSAAAGSSTPPLREAYDFCKTGNNRTLDLGDDGHTLIIDTGSDGDLDGAVCVLTWIETPDSVINRLDHTTAMMGSQTADADGFTYQWTYHPDNGLNLVVTD